MTTVNVSIRELRNSTADVIRTLEQGVEVTLTNRGRPIARISPITATSSGQQLLDALDRIGTVDTGLGADVAAWRSEDAEAELARS